MSRVPDISVVMATHNRADRLRAAIDGLRAQTLPKERFEVVIVDDGSTDGTPEVLAAALEGGDLHLRAVRRPEPGGPAAARNRGWRLARAATVAFTDDDCVATPRWLEELLAAASSDARAVVQGQTQPDPAEASALGPYAKTMRIGGPSPHFETCNIAYPRALLEAVDGFDERYPAPAGEDSDLGWRAKAAGGRHVFVPEALVHHAVFARGPLDRLRDAMLATEGVQAYKRVPGLREHLHRRIFYTRTHALLLQAIAGVLLARRLPPALLLAAPYARTVQWRAKRDHAPVRKFGFYLVYDAVQIAATIRGAIRHRFPVI